jgi:hypothetical protein
MRFACQSCGKAYNLPEEKIADKSNVKLKCRVCGAIVEVKRLGDVVAQILGDVDGKRGRVSEAPAPLTSMSPDDGDDATHAIAVGDQILAEGNQSPDAAAAALLGHVKSALGQQRGLVPLPPPPPTGFGNTFGASSGFGAPPSSPLGSSPVQLGNSSPVQLGSPPAFGSAPVFGNASAPFGAGSVPPFGSNALPFGATPVPPPLSAPDGSAFGRGEPPAVPPLPASPYPASPIPPSFPEGAGSPPPPLPGGDEPLHNGSNGMSGGFSGGMAPRFGDVVAMPDEPAMPPPPAPMTGTMSAFNPEYPQVAVAPLPSGNIANDTKRKMLAAFATGLLIGFIIARLFF